MFEKMVIDLKLLNYSKRTIDSYVYWNKKFLEFIKKKPTGIKNKDIESFQLCLQLNGKSSRTIRLMLASLDSIMLMCVKEIL